MRLVQLGSVTSQLVSGRSKKAWNVQEFISNLSDLSWWGSVVVVGLIISILSAYAKDWIDILLGTLFSKWKISVSIKKRAREERVAILVVDKHEQIKALVRVNYFALRSVSNTIMAVLVVLMTTSWPYTANKNLAVLLLSVFTIFLMSLSISDGMRAYKLKSVIDEAEKTAANIKDAVNELEG
ncbi:hypothetical protein [Pseudomonas sp. 18173]|uniref:hypothetical protein n=1 Tax=Pseudomonas sp. 18173 TaxID=3390055 RepID=UPI003D1BEB28